MAKAGVLFVGTDDGAVLFSNPNNIGRWLRIGEPSAQPEHGPWGGKGGAQRPPHPGPLPEGEGAGGPGRTRGPAAAVRFPRRTSPASR